MLNELDFIMNYAKNIQWDAIIHLNIQIIKLLMREFHLDFLKIINILFKCV